MREGIFRLREERPSVSVCAPVVSAGSERGLFASWRGGWMAGGWFFPLHGSLSGERLRAGRVARAVVGAAIQSGVALVGLLVRC